MSNPKENSLIWLSSAKAPTGDEGTKNRQQFGKTLGVDHAVVVVDLRYQTRRTSWCLCVLFLLTFQISVSNDSQSLTFLLLQLLLFCPKKYSPELATAKAVYVTPKE